VNRRIEGWLQRRWYEGVDPGFALRLVAGAYGLALRARARPPASPLPVPVLVIGNFTAGGTGKTPLVIAIAKSLASHGYRPGIVSRGYGRRSSRPLQVDTQTSVEDCGDEPRLIFEHTGLPVFVDADRVAAAQRAIAGGCDLVIADDGLQHRRLHRDVEIEVVDGERGYGNGLLLPAGPLRELPRRCDLRVANGEGTAAKPGDWTMQLALGDAIALTDLAQRRPVTSFVGQRVHAVAGIGNPERFFTALERAGLSVTRCPFPDHHVFLGTDFPDDTDTVLMTEKDAVKCRTLGLGNAWAVPVEARLPAEFFQALLSRLRKP
jgi:tetraacyldisaccharide 4'-kinase